MTVMIEILSINGECQIKVIQWACSDNIKIIYKQKKPDGDKIKELNEKLFSIFDL